MAGKRRRSSKNKEKKERNVLSILSGIVFDFSKIKAKPTDKP